MPWFLAGLAVAFILSKVATDGDAAASSKAASDAAAAAKAKADADAAAASAAAAVAAAEAEAKKLKAAEETKSACSFESSRLDAVPFTFQMVYKPLNGRMIGPTIRELIQNLKAEKKDFDFWLMVLMSEYEQRKLKFMPTPTMADIDKLRLCLKAHAAVRFGG